MAAAAAAAAAQAALTEALKNVKPPLEGIPTDEDPTRKPLAEWVWHTEAFYRARGLDAVLTFDEDNAGVVNPDFDWEAMSDIKKKQDSTVFLMMTSALSYQTSQAVRGVRHAAPLWRKLKQARLSVMSKVMHLHMSCGDCFDEY